MLVIHLKRFSYSRSMKHKLETFVNFPIHDFDLTNYVANKNNSQRQLYELYALTNHYGGMGSGHYTAHIKVIQFYLPFPLRELSLSCYLWCLFVVCQDRNVLMGYLTMLSKLGLHHFCSLCIFCNGITIYELWYVHIFLCI